MRDVEVVFFNGMSIGFPLVFLYSEESFNTMYCIQLVHTLK